MLQTLIVDFSLPHKPPLCHHQSAYVAEDHNFTTTYIHHQNCSLRTPLHGNASHHKGVWKVSRSGVAMHAEVLIHSQTIIGSGKRPDRYVHGVL